MRIILASTSPRRQQLLNGAGLNFTTMAANIDETWQNNECAQAYIVRMVKTKAKKACQEINDKALVITADTIGVLDDGQVLTKPKDRGDAFAMWDKLSDSTHEVWTAVCASVVDDGEIICQEWIVCRTQISFVELTDEMKQRYWDTGEPIDKAGAYAIQGGAMAWVRTMNGSYTNVVGLPVAQTLELIERICGRLVN